MAALFLPGCSPRFSAGYLWQAVRGQLGIVRVARPLPEVIADSEVPPRLRRLLASVARVKAFGEEQGLRPTRNYESYAELGRPAAVWVVQASAPLAFEPRTWSFPVVGSVPYLGFFDRRAAERYAARLAKDESLDVDVRAASAYSTLGWFRDPVLSTMVRGGEPALGSLANTVLHESVHATLYVKNQSTFDENLASFVADRLTPLWLRSTLGSEAPETEAWEKLHLRQRAYLERMHRTRLELELLYASGASREEKLSRKAEILERVQQDFRLTRPLNNASLTGYATYDSGVAAFEGLLAACGGRWPRFVAALSSLTARDFERPQQQELDALLAGVASRACTPEVASRPKMTSRCSFRTPPGGYRPLTGDTRGHQGRRRLALELNFRRASQNPRRREGGAGSPPAAAPPRPPCVKLLRVAHVRVRPAGLQPGGGGALVLATLRCVPGSWRIHRRASRAARRRVARLLGRRVCGCAPRPCRVARRRGWRAGGSGRGDCAARSRSGWFAHRAGRRGRLLHPGFAIVGRAGRHADEKHCSGETHPSRAH